MSLITFIFCCHKCRNCCSRRGKRFFEVRDQHECFSLFITHPNVCRKAQYIWDRKAIRRFSSGKCPQYRQTSVLMWSCIKHRRGSIWKRNGFPEITRSTPSIRILLPSYLCCACNSARRQFIYPASSSKFPRQYACVWRNAIGYQRFIYVCQKHKRERKFGRHFHSLRRALCCFDSFVYCFI